MATAPHDAAAPALPATGALYQRWRTEPRDRLINLETDPAAWRFAPIDLLELLAFDQCLVLGAACPGPLHGLGRAARRDRVVRNAHDALRRLYACVVGRIPAARRHALLDEVAAAVEQGVGSPAALLPFAEWDPDPRVRAAAGRHTR